MKHWTSPLWCVNCPFKLWCRCSNCQSLNQNDIPNSHLFDNNKLHSIMSLHQEHFFFHFLKLIVKACSVSVFIIYCELPKTILLVNCRKHIFLSHRMGFLFLWFLHVNQKHTFITLCKCSHLDMHMAEEIMLWKHGVSPFESAIYWKPQCINCKSRNVEFKRIKTYFYKSVDCVVSKLEVYSVLLSHLGTSVV